MLSFYVVLLTAWLGLLATARGLLAADCDSATEHLVLLDEAQYSSDDMLSDERVVLEGVVQSVFSPQNFIIQSSDGGFRVSVITPSPVDLTDQMGERVRVAGIMLPTGGPPTLMLPMGTEVGSAVVLCSQNSHARHLLNGHLYGKGASEDTGGEPCKPCNWFR